MSVEIFGTTELSPNRPTGIVQLIYRTLSNNDVELAGSVFFY